MAKRDRLRNSQGYSSPGVMNGTPATNGSSSASESNDAFTPNGMDTVMNEESSTPRGRGLVSKSNSGTPSSNLIVSCSRCKATFHRSDMRCHTPDVCESANRTKIDPTSHPFCIKSEEIPDGFSRFHTMATECKDKDLENIPEKYHDHLVLMNTLTMDHLGRSPGDHVMLNVSNGTGNLLDTFVGVVFINDSIKKLNVAIHGFPFKEGCLTFEDFRGLNEKITKPCLSLALKPDGDNHKNLNKFDLLKHLKEQLIGRVILSSRAIVIKIKDDKIKFIVSEIVSDFEDQDDGRKALIPFQITSRTIIRIDSDASRSVSLPDVIGHEVQINKLKRLIDDLIKINSSTDANSGHEKKKTKKRYLPTGVLIHGFNGTGKSLSMEALINHYQDQVFIQLIDCNSVIASTSDKIIKRLKSIFEVVEMYKPSVVIFDHLEELFVSKKVSSATDKEVASLFKVWFRNVISKDNQILVIGTTNNLDAIDTLRWPEMFMKLIEFSAPKAGDRRKVLTNLIKSMSEANNIKSGVSQDAINAIADSAFGYTGADLLSVVSEAISCASSEDRSLSDADISSAVSLTRPSAMREMKLECQPIPWSSIGGVSTIKKEIDQIVIWPIKEPFSRFYEAMSMAKSSGILLYGPPGCSKTMIGQAIATESKLNFLSIRGPELFSKYVGDSEKGVRDLFSKARSAAPSMIFIDEIDALAPERGSSSGNSGVGDRMVNTLLIEMDGIQGLKDVVVIGATNRPQVIDPALKRPGRFDREIYVPLPDLKARKEIFDINLRGRPTDKDVDTSFLASRTERFSGAEISGIVKRAALKAIEDHVSACGLSCDIQDKMSSLKLSSDKKEASDLVIKWKHFEEALKIKPRTSDEMIKSFEEYYQNLNYELIRVQN